MMENRVGLSLLASLGMLVMACGSESGGTVGPGGGGGNGSCAMGEVECGEDCLPAADGSLTWVQENIFDVNSCAVSSCHAGSNQSPLEDLDLTDEMASFDSLVNVESSQAAPRVLVVPNDSSASYLINKLTGEGIEAGSLMPTGAQVPLCDAKIDGVRAWINAGANP